MWRNRLRFGSLVNISVSVPVGALDNSQHVDSLKLFCQGEVSSYGPQCYTQDRFQVKTK